MPPDPGCADPRDGDDRAVASVLRAVDLVEERMGDPIGVQEMAHAACYSPFHFSRLFARATGHAPYDYLMRRRVAAAAEDLVRGTGSVTEIALSRGFEVPDTFTRAFRRCFGLLPSDARRDGDYPRRIARTRIPRPYLEAMLHGGPYVPEAGSSDATVFVGTWGTGHEPPEAGVTLLVERDADLRATRTFRGAVEPPRIPADRPAPGFPRCATGLGAGPRARFRLGPRPDLLPFLLEYAYRAWLPSTGRTAAPAFDLVEADPGGNLAFVLPLP